MASIQSSQGNEAGLEQAIEWYLLLASGEATPEQEQAFRRWHAEPQHARVYSSLDKVWSSFEGVSSPIERYTLDQSLNENTSGSGSTVRQALLVAGLCLSAWFGYQSSTGQLISADHYALTQQTTLYLDDQSKLHLAPMSAVNLKFSDTERRIELVSGALQIEVAKDKTRPLIIHTEDGSAEALGTIFSVSRAPDQMQVNVSESTVRVCPAQIRAGHANCVIATAGDQVRVSDDLARLQGAQSGRLQINWDKQLLVVEERPLLEVLDLLQRHHPGYLKSDREGLASVRVSGVFPLKDLRQSLDIMATSLSLEISHYTPALTLIRKKSTDS